MTFIEQILAAIALLVVGIALCRSAIGLHRVALELAMMKLSSQPENPTLDMENLMLEEIRNLEKKM